MSVKILEKDMIIKQNSDGFTPLIIGQPTTIFTARAQRLRQLAQDSFMGDYLLLVGQIAQQQANLAEQFESQIQTLAAQQTPLWPLTFDNTWMPLLTKMLNTMLDALIPVVSEDMLAVLNEVKTLDNTTLEQYFSQLQQNQFDSVPSEQAILLFAVLNTFVSLYVAALRLEWQPALDKKQHNCPLCGAAPVASLVKDRGVRYLHCSQCEAQWHRLRAECTQCDDGEDIQLKSATLKDAVRAETCSHCNSYLKILFLEKDFKVEPIADDLATLVLDQKLAEDGLLRSGFNPYLLPLMQ
ncbi:formate dehydrogenase accessory protein FdhE [Photobacterium damselae subsp. damselae]|uniref:formate dehydrogenase accessory protein FdhE n=1 Tax=Photobacterium damselae TaxID=38293 RepID=UPI000A2FF372|nr:formate dehydrogenase accessory protein FdhE [Photobacterium damselae]ARR48551.1 formate dehydrogenase accessory protein FdhE [Photobacterium damselae subsp. damselae]QAY34406.1 formate dehydrogenase accessory protein FdhE [Photobacterium damselae subsp. damselae]